MLKNRERDQKALASAMSRRIQGTVRAQVHRIISQRDMFRLYDSVLSTVPKQHSWLIAMIDPLRACWSETKLLYDKASMSLKGIERLVNKTNIFRIKGFAAIANELFECEELSQAKKLPDEELIVRLKGIQLKIKNLIIVFLCDTFVILHAMHKKIAKKLGKSDYLLAIKVKEALQPDSYVDWVSNIKKSISEVHPLLLIARESKKVELPCFANTHEEADRYICTLQRHIKAYNDYITAYRYFECEIKQENAESSNGILSHIANALSKIF